MYGHNNADFAQGIVMQEIKDREKLSVMEHSPLWSLRVEILDRKTALVVGIDHVFASGAVIGCATTQEWGRPSPVVWIQLTPRVRGGAFNHGSWRKNVVNFHSTTIIYVVAIKPCNFEAEFPQLNRYRQLQVNTAFLGEYVAVHARWHYNGRRM